MRLTLRIVSLVVASILAFMVMAMTEARDVFGPWMRGEAVAPAPVSEEAVDAALRRLAADLRAGEPVGMPGTIARLADEEDRAFRRSRGVDQDLELVDLEIERVMPTGPRAVEVTTEERSRLRISRPGGTPRTYILSGTWRYTLRKGPDGTLGVVDFRPIAVDLQPTNPEPPQ